MKAALVAALAVAALGVALGATVLVLRKQQGPQTASAFNVAANGSAAPSTSTTPAGPTPTTDPPSDVPPAEPQPPPKVFHATPRKAARAAAKERDLFQPGTGDSFSANCGSVGSQEIVCSPIHEARLTGGYCWKRWETDAWTVDKTTGQVSVDR